MPNNRFSWYVVYTRSKQERRACLNLETWHVETFNPERQERRCNQFTGQPTYLVKSLFPNYIFARFDASTMLHNILSTRGVKYVLSTGGSLVSIDEELIELIQSRIGEDGFVRLGDDDVKVGDKVTIKDGPLRNLQGVFSAEMKDTERVLILLDVVKYQARIETTRDQLQKVS
ncbi:MAG TPA: transcription termination/antitermination NusG family protein [Pyrinomonadaceae bacterium]